ncbi:MAG TPA: GWxTD domain-containing protein [Ignavibacteria bacterium]|nr:GWxTD domain-containing protein [Ignavibacteria bacterium]
MNNKYNERSCFIFSLKNSLIIFISLLFVFFHKNIAFPQLVDKTLNSNGKELFYFDPMVFYSNDEKKPRLDAYIEIPLENLQFKKNNDTKMYDASVNYDIKITNSANEVVVNESTKDYVSTSKSDQKKLEESAKFIVKEYYLNPGKYNLEITLTDINTKSEKTVKSKIEVVDFSQKDVSFSDIMLVSNIKIDNGKKVITPLIDKNIDNLKVLYLFFEIYNSKDEKIINDCTYKITDSKDNVIEQGSYNFPLAPGINKFFEKLSTDNLVFGDYKLEIKGNLNGEKFAEKIFSNRMSGIPKNAKDLDLMIDQMIYIASSDEINKIRDASTNELKQKYFFEFWKSKDPSPNSSRNELLNEYYKRIRTANERYSHYIDGWKTDMGMIYIVYGNPNSVERYPNNENTKPYEIWEYYNINKQFIFVDDSGFGDYKLTNPVWDETGNRINN